VHYGAIDLSTRSSRARSQNFVIIDTSNCGYIGALVQSELVLIMSSCEYN
jgi:hypothetical protein